MTTTPLSLEALIESIPDCAKDIRLNLGSVLMAEGAPDLTGPQIAGVALASAYATRVDRVSAALEAHLRPVLGAEGVQASRAAAAIMAMNNVYYRFTHAVEDPELSRMPARLRMTVMANPGVPKLDFELMSLAVSMINGCGMCMKAHAHEVAKGGITKTGTQSVARIAATVAAAAQALLLPQD